MHLTPKGCQEGVSSPPMDSGMKGKALQLIKSGSLPNPSSMKPQTREGQKLTWTFRDWCLVGKESTLRETWSSVLFVSNSTSARGGWLFKFDFACVTACGDGGWILRSSVLFRHFWHQATHHGGVEEPVKRRTNCGKTTIRAPPPSVQHTILREK